FLDADGGVQTKKVPSSVDNYARAIVEGMKELLGDPDVRQARAIVDLVHDLMTTADVAGREVTEIVHGTTVGANAILQLRGATPGLTTTGGSRDALETRRIRMPRLYDLRWEKPQPLVERYLRLEVDERIDAHGQIQRPLAPADVERALDRLLAE